MQEEKHALSLSPLKISITTISETRPLIFQHHSRVCSVTNQALIGGVVGVLGLVLAVAQGPDGLRIAGLALMCIGFLGILHAACCRQELPGEQETEPPTPSYV